MRAPVLTVYRQRLPHWRMDSSTYFVTWRVALSQAALKCDERTLVANAIKYLAGDRYDLLAFVVMNDQLHVVAARVDDFSLQEIVHSWKSFTTNRLQRNFGRIGRIWQTQYFDRIIRNESDLWPRSTIFWITPGKDGQTWRNIHRPGMISTCEATLRWAGRNAGPYHTDAEH